MEREIALDLWLNETLGTREYTRLALAGDCSFRKYYRIRLKQDSYVVMDAPPPEVPATFVAIAELLERQTIKVPEIKAFESTQGFVLMSDFGDKLYLRELTEKTAPLLYQTAVNTLLKMQVQTSVATLPVFDGEYQQRQWNLLKDWYLKTHLNITLSEEILDTIAALAEQLLRITQEQPQVFVHQDYHSRNLMLIEEGSLGVLDFQDAVQGPITYDLVSLLQDAYIAWPRSKVETWVLSYQEEAQTLGVLSHDISQTAFLRWMDLTGLQRHLKNLGVFARMHHRNGRSEYLNNIPQLQHYIRETFQRYEELHEHAALFDIVLETKQSKESKESQVCMPSS